MIHDASIFQLVNPDRDQSVRPSLNEVYFHEMIKSTRPSGSVWPMESTASKIGHYYMHKHEAQTFPLAC